MEDDHEDETDAPQNGSCRSTIIERLGAALWKGFA